MKKPSRRNFISSVGALAGASLIPDIADAAQSPQGWDLAFVDRFTGKHRQVFDVMDTTIGLLVVKNWLDAWQTVYGLKGPDVNAIVGIAGKGFPINVSDAIYAKYPIGELWQVTDPSTGGRPAMKNLWFAGDRPGQFSGAGVKPLQDRGVLFWMCNNALNAAAGRIATATQKPQPEIYQDLRAGLNPGVIVVPAHTMLVGIVQEKGFTYEVV